MDDEAACPRCRTTKYRNPNLKLMVNVCGHALCESCVELLFVRGSGNCTECNTALRRINFRLQFFEDGSIEKELEIRKKILKDYNLKEDSFATLREYNDYLEEVETIIFNLVNDVDAESTRKKVEAYRKENKDLIAHNKFKKSADELYIESCLAVETATRSQNISVELAKDQAHKKMEREKEQQLLIDNLMFSDGSADDILQSHQNTQRLRKQANVEQPKTSTKNFPDISSHLGHQTTFVPLTKKQEALYRYEELIMENYGPAPPSIDDVRHKGYLRHMRTSATSEKAGGYEAAIGCLKALQSAVDGLFISGISNYSPVPSNAPSSSNGSHEGMDISP
ncbi:CDK-activating kinase assembly factor MAT1-like isoform X2 [Watersipora subatra]